MIMIGREDNEVRERTVLEMKVVLADKFETEW